MNNTVITDLKELTKLLIADKISDTHQAAATPNTTSEKWLFSFTLSFVVAISALFLLITISILGIVLCAIRRTSRGGFQPLISKTNSNDLELSQVLDGGDGMSVSSCDRTDSFTSTAITCQYCGKVATNGLDSPNKGQKSLNRVQKSQTTFASAIKNKMKKSFTAGSLRTHFVSPRNMNTKLIGKRYHSYSNLLTTQTNHEVSEDEL